MEKYQLTADEEGEEFVLENDWDTAIPVSFEAENSILQISCFPKVEEQVKDWVEEHLDDPFSEDSLSMLWEKIDPVLRNLGYIPEPHREKWGYIYRSSAQASGILPGTVEIKARDEGRNDTTYDLEMTVEDGRVGFGSVENGRIVSVAVTHSSPEDSRIVEIGVETVKVYRKKGLATSNLKALSNHLLRLGNIPEYRCYKTNIGSRRTAEKAGFQEVGKYYYYVLRKEYNE